MNLIALTITPDFLRMIATVSGKRPCVNTQPSVVEKVLHSQISGFLFQIRPFAIYPHTFRTTLVRLGETICRSPEEWKAWSQNLGHESEMTTFASYGQVPGHRQAEIMQALYNPRPPPLPAEGLIDALETLLQNAKRAPPVR
jgi:hypothetical protein